MAELIPTIAVDVIHPGGAPPPAGPPAAGAPPAFGGLVAAFLGASDPALVAPEAPLSMLADGNGLPAALVATLPVALPAIGTSSLSLLAAGRGTPTPLPAAATSAQTAGALRGTAVDPELSLLLPAPGLTPLPAGVAGTDLASLLGRASGLEAASADQAIPLPNVRIPEATLLRGPDTMPVAWVPESPLAATESMSPQSLTGTRVINVPVAQQGWGNAVSDRVLWLINENVSAAKLQLNPPELGPIDVRIAIERDGASIHFTSQHALVREALDAALPRLRDALGEQGLTLLNVNVSEQSLAQHGGDGEAGRGGESGEDGSAEAENSVHAAPMAHVNVGMVDLFA